MNPGWLDQVRLIFEMLIIGCLVNFNHLRKMDKNTRWAVRFLKVRDLKSGLKGSKDKKSNKKPWGRSIFLNVHSWLLQLEDEEHTFGSMSSKHHKWGRTVVHEKCVAPGPGLRKTLPRSCMQSSALWTPHLQALKQWILSWWCWQWE